MPDEYVPYFVIIFIGLTLVFLVGIIIWSIRQASQRKEALEQLSREMGFQFEPKLEKSQVNELVARKDFKLFQRGHSRRAKNRLTGQRGRARVELFDYIYTTGGGRHQQTHHHSVALFSSSTLNLPVFRLRSANVFDRLAEKLGKGDIQVEHRPDFDKRYHLDGIDREAIMRLFSDPVITFFEERQNLSAEGALDTLIVYRGPRLVKPEDMHAFLQDAESLYHLLSSQ